MGACLAGDHGTRGNESIPEQRLCGDTCEMVFVKPCFIEEHASKQMREFDVVRIVGSARRGGIFAITCAIAVARCRVML